MIADLVRQVEELAGRIVGRDDCLVIAPGNTIAGAIRSHYQTIIVLPGGTLELRPGAEIVFKDVPIDPAIDPYGWGNGLVVLGKIVAHGTPKKRFVRRTAQQPIDWLGNDLCLYPDSRRLRSDERFARYVPQWEVIPVNRIPSKSHPDSYLGEYKPHVANLSGDIVIRSENPAGVRGHVLFMYRAEVDVTDVEFRSTGRTTVDDVKAKRNLGRYPIHFHHLWGPTGRPTDEAQFRFVNNTVWCELDPEVCNFPWGIVLHDSHFGDVKGNVVHNWHGYGIGLQSGNETGNRIEGNLVSGIHGEANPRDQNALDASGFWFRSPFSFVRNNIACGIHCHFKGLVPGVGYQLISKAANSSNKVRVPKSPGADMENVAETVEANTQSFVPSDGWWEDNKSYGCGTGLTFWDFWGQHVYVRQVAWNCHQEGVYLYPHSKVRFIDPVVVSCGAGMRSGDYPIGNWEVLNPRFVDCDLGIADSTNYRSLTVRGGLMDCTQVGVRIQTIADPGSWSVFGPTGDTGPGRMTLIDGVDFEFTPLKIDMKYDASKLDTRLLIPDKVSVKDFDGQDFTLYYREQAGSYTIPAVRCTGAPIVPTELVFLTNQQAWERFGKCIAGAVAPTTAGNVSGIGGLVEWFTPPLQPIITAGPDLTTTWPQNTVQLQGGVQNQGDWSLRWEHDPGPDEPMASLSDWSELQPTAIFPRPGTYAFELRAEKGSSAVLDAMKVYVLPESAPEPKMISVPRDEILSVQGALQATTLFLQKWLD